MAFLPEQMNLLRLLEDVSTDSDSIEDESEEETHEPFELEYTETDTEQSGESDVISDDECIPKKPKIEFLIGKDGTIWNRNQPAVFRSWPSNNSDCFPGVNIFAKHSKTASECWSLIFSDNLLKIIEDNTNFYIRKFSGKNLAKYTDLIEIKAFIGLLYLAGCHKNSRLNMKELFNRNGLGIERFWLTMSKDRFYFLLKTLQFDYFYTRENRIKIDTLAPVRQLLKLFVENCQKCFNVSKYVTIDEKTEAFHEGYTSKYHKPKNPNKHGVKIFALVDAKTRYTLNLEVYKANQPNGPSYATDGKLSIITNLIEPISGTGRNITCDNWFTSISLIKTLLRDHGLTCVGSIRKYKGELPLELINTKSRPSTSSVFGFQKDMTIVSYVPKTGKNVIVASSFHHDNTVDLSPEGKNVPEIIAFYNSTKGSVNVVDDLCETYDVARNTHRWPMMIFYALLNIAGINSQILHTCNNGETKQMARRSFLKELAISLTDKEIKRRGVLTNIVPEIKPVRQEVAEKHATVDQFPPGIRKKCFKCNINRKTRFFCDMCRRFICLEHSQYLCSDCYTSTKE
ncbi:piggyBac transposable element-derived protein 4 [Caerostris darwini]|uniref:PiggyBac transposable element-derived protein 4 n=1 Tax=Caerostris darwini TaxID=1538125 RepID=A0AAV4U495_9ARAC|nr:piggyBac transposable element-derived protein 4 [Caerostris darwini]